MTSEKIIKIKPFRDIWFKDCFHMALIPPVIHNLGNADCLIFNHIWRYGYEDNSLLGHLKEFGNVYEILNSKGIKCIPLTNHEEDISGFVIDKLNNNNFVIVGVDNYYERIRKDFYNIKHSGHSILINGYDESKSFFAIEQPFFYSYEYDICNVDVEDLKKAYLSYR